MLTAVAADVPEEEEMDVEEAAVDDVGLDYLTKNLEQEETSLQGQVGQIADVVSSSVLHLVLTSICKFGIYRNLETLATVVLF